MEADKIARVVGKRLYTTECCQQSETIGAELIGITLWNDRVIVGVASLYQAALDGTVAIAHFGVTFVEANNHITTVLTQEIT